MSTEQPNQFHNLPWSPTPFIGRDQEVSEIDKLLADPACHLLTLVGAGGVGKTRLGVQAVSTRPDNPQSSQAEMFAHGVYYVPLQPLDSAEFLVSAVADALDFQLAGQTEPRQQLLNYLSDKEALLLLDNFEHLLDGADLLSDLLRAAPAVKLLTTSRQALNLQEEWLYPVPGLPFPESANAEDFSAYGAVRLFRERARRVRPDFSLDEERAGVLRICQLVEGMPLAIELAASWLRTLRCAEIAAEIQRNLDFLATSLRNVPERHRNMQAVFDHSWTLLSQAERQVFQQLSVFRGGFRREAAEVIAEATLPVLSALVDKSLLRRDDNGRYHIHELLRQYGAEKLAETPAAIRHVRHRHGAFYADFLHQRLQDVNSLGQRQAATEIAAELENVRAAWQWAVDQTKVEEIHRSASTFFYFCQLQSRFLEGANALEEAARSLEKLTDLETPSAREQRDLTLAQVLNHQGWLRIRVGEFEKAEAVLEKSRAIYERLNASLPPFMGADSAVPLAIVALIRGEQARSVSLAEEARQASQARGDKHNLAFAHYGLTAAKLAQGEYKVAYRHAQRACALARTVGNRWFLAYPLNEWGNVARAMGDYAEAKKHYQASYTVKEEFDDAEGMAVALNHLGEIAVLQEEYEEARQLFGQSLDLYRELNDRGGLATSLKGLGQVACTLREFQTAKQQFRQSLQIAADIQFLPLVFSIFIEVEPLLRQQDAPELSVALLSLVQDHAASAHETKTEAQRRLDEIQARMPADAFTAAVRRGQEWDLETAVAALQSELIVPPQPEDGRPKPEQPLIDPLTERELDVLHLMAQGYTNPEIGEELVIALGTVKWYASQIYSKLNVSNRTEAAARARELGLLP